MLKIAICDDNNAVCTEIEQVLCNYALNSSLKIDIEVFYDGIDLLNFIQDNHPFDLIFLDIELINISGIKVGSKIRHDFDDHISKIVFISAKSGYEQALFDMQPLNFLRKPLAKEQLINCLNLAIKILEKENKTFSFKMGYQHINIAIKDILYLESNLKKIKLVTTNKQYVFYGSLDKNQQLLPSIFVRVHGSFITNFNNIEQIGIKELVMINGDKIPISQRNLKNLRLMQAKLGRERKNGSI